MPQNRRFRYVELAVFRSTEDNNVVRLAIRLSLMKGDEGIDWLQDRPYESLLFGINWYS